MRQHFGGWNGGSWRELLGLLVIGSSQVFHHCTRRPYQALPQPKLPPMSFHGSTQAARRSRAQDDAPSGAVPPTSPKVYPLYRTAARDDDVIPGVCFIGQLMAGGLFGALFGLVARLLCWDDRCIPWMIGVVRETPPNPLGWTASF